MTRAARERRQVLVPILVASALAWGLLVLGPTSTVLTAHCSGALNDSSAVVPLEMILVHNPPGPLALGWLLMTVAMMLPLMSAPVRHVRDRSFRRQRSRAIALFLASYLSIWLIAGFALSAGVLAIRLLSGGSRVPLVLLLLSLGLYEISPLKQACLNRGHAHPALSAFGRAAEIDVLRFGWAHGAWCVGSCWALMLLPLLFTRGHLAAMALVTLWLVAERLERPLPPQWRLRGFRKAICIVVAETKRLASTSAFRATN